uniref:Uncharacterized protein n=1 Tax=Timema monikensis TaxID=170555 RepID=A0A7R9E750_9NEOP|nr:unnamed protein product [Timema monikensis]
MRPWIMLHTNPPVTSCWAMSTAYSET